MGCVFAYVMILALVGPENLGHNFDVAHDVDLADAAGTDALAAVVHHREGGHLDEASSGSDKDEEKGVEGGGVRREFAA